MENAIYKDKKLVAMDVAENYNYEKLIREAGSKGELLCPDPDCKFRELRYKHGEKRIAYFAHKNNTFCDYSKFDSNNSAIMRIITRKLFTYFRNAGYNVQMEKKLLSHHYSHIVFEIREEIFALDLTTKQMSVVKMRPLVDEYREKRLKNKWLVIDKVDSVFREDETYFIKRNLLNESLNNNLLIIDFDAERIAQYRLDTTVYEKEIHLPKLYREYGTIEDLILENFDIQLKGFEERFQQWINQNKEKVHNEIKREEEQRLKQKQAKEEKEKYQQIQNDKNDEQYSIAPKDNGLYLEIEEEIKQKINDPKFHDRIIYDSHGIRWVKCKKCGKIASEKEFYSYGGENVNLGKCYDCLRSNSLK